MMLEIENPEISIYADSIHNYKIENYSVVVTTDVEKVEGEKIIYLYPTHHFKECMKNNKAILSDEILLAKLMKYKSNFFENNKPFPEKKWWLNSYI